MAGHSQFANIKHRKGAQDKKRASMFTKAGREIIIAARLGGPDPEYNPRLRAAITAARAVNMPKDKIEYAIKKGSGQLGGDENYEEIRYEAYAPGGIALIIEAATDNRNRTASEVRSTLTKGGGNLGETGSVGFMFDRIGLINYPADKAGAEEMFEAALEAGAADCVSDKNIHEITCENTSLAEVTEYLRKKFGDPEVSKLAWKPKNTIEIDFETAQKVLDLIDTLDEDDDVQSVYANYEISDEVAKKLENAG